MTLTERITERIINLRKAKAHCQLPRDQKMLWDINSRLYELEAIAIDFGFYPKEEE